MGVGYVTGVHGALSQTKGANVHSASCYCNNCYAYRGIISASLRAVHQELPSEPQWFGGIFLGISAW